MKVPLATFYLHPSMKSYQDLLVQKSASSSPDQAASTSDDSFECKENSCVAVEVEPSIKKAENVITTNIPTITATSTLTLSTTTKIAATSNSKESIEEKPSLHSAAVKADCIPVATVPHPTCSVFVTPPMSNVYQASVSSVDISLRSTHVTDVSAQMAAAHTSNIPLAAVAAAVSEPTQNPASMELGPTSSGLHVSGELKVKLGNQSPKQSKLSENPDFKIWISNLAEAAERTGQISVC